MSVTANLVCTFFLSAWCHNAAAFLGVTTKKRRLILPSCSLCFLLLSLHSPPTTSLQSKPQLQFHLTNNTNPKTNHTTPQQWAPSHPAYVNPPPCDRHGQSANILQFNSVVSAITSCFMAIVNGIVTICKAIINVRQTVHQRYNTQTTNAKNRASSPSSPSSPTASPAARPAADAERPQQALSRGTFDTRCHRKSSTRPCLTER